MSKVLIVHPIPEVGIRMLQEKYEVVVNEAETALSHEELVNLVKGNNYHALITQVADKVDEEVLTAVGDQLRIVANFAVGFDNIDLEAAAKRNVFVTNTPGVANQSVAEHNVALILALAKSLVNADKYVRAGKFQGWDPNLFLGSQVNGKTLGVIGVGNIGKTLVQTASMGLNMKILYNDVVKADQLEMLYKAKFASIEDLLKQSDFVAVLVPLLPSTRHLINADRLKLMKKTAFLVNTSRGPVVDEAALAEAVKTGVIAGAALDVFENEPEVNPDLLASDKVILTPHIASATRETRALTSKMAAQNVIAALTGQAPPNLIKH